MAKLGDMVEYLKRNGIPHEVIEQTQTTTNGRATNTPQPFNEKDPVKTFIIHADNKRCMLVVPANIRPNEGLLSKAMQAKDLHFAQQDDLKTIFPECELDAMPPFGNLYALPVILDKELAKEKEIIFKACSQSKSIRLKMNDYLRLVKPLIKELS